MSDYLTDFVQESEERITELNNALLTLEEDPDDEEAMDQIFRIAHTLKGNAGAMGLEPASDLAHAIEDLLDAVRGDDLEVTPALMDDIFDGVDELETMVAEVGAAGEIETDPSATIGSLREHLSESAEPATGITTPTADEIDDICSRFEPPTDDSHNAYLARLAIAKEEGVNNGELVVEALIDAFDLIGTDPPRETIEAGEYGDSFDAVFATAVGETAIASGLEPVEEVDDFEIVAVTDRFDAVDERAGAGETDAAAEPGDGITADEAQDLEVDDLLDEFTEFDDLDEMVEDVEDEELDAFEDMGEAGSFDDLLDDEDVTELEGGAGDPPTEPDVGDEGGSGPAGDSQPAADDDAAGTAQSAEEDVEDAGAVFNELKDEVEMVGFDELQDELEELEFDEFDEEEEVDMDELLGEDADDDSFLDAAEPSEDAVDDVLVDSGPTDDAAAVEEVGADPTTADADADADEALEPAEDDLETATDDIGPDQGVATAEDAADAPSADFEGADDTGFDDDTATAQDPGDAPPDGEPESAAAEAGVEPETAPVDSEPETASESEVGGADGETAAGDAGTGDEAVADDSVAEEPSPGDGVADEAGSDAEVVDEPVVDDEVGEEAVSDDETGESAVTDDATVADTGRTDGVDPLDDDGESDAFGSGDDSSDDAVTTPVDADSVDTESVDDATESVDPDDDGASDSFGADADDAFEPTAGFDDTGDVDSSSETDAFDDTDGFDVDADDPFDDVDDDPVGADLDADDDFDDGFDDEMFGGTDEFDTADAGFDSPTSTPETNDDSNQASEASFGSDTADSGDEDESGDVRIVDEPEMEIPDLSIPETSDQPDADAERDESQSVRVDIEQVDSLLTLVEGLVTSRVRLRHAADSDDGGTALEKELDALSDLTTDLQETVMDIRLVPLQTVTNRLPRVVRDIARDQNKEVDFEIHGEDVEIDRSILDRIGDPLIHLVRNAVDHGIESPAEREEAGKPREGAVEVHADRARDRVTITVEDDGGGLDPDRLRDEAVEAGILDADAADAMPDEDAYDLIFHSGLSTADEVTDVSGRGVGMDVVKRTIEDLDGTVSIDSDEGDGTTVTMTLPVTVAIDEILFVESGGEEFGVPTKAVQDIESAGSIETAEGESVLPGEGGDFPVISLADVLETPAPGANGDGMVVRIRDEVREVALHCDHVHGQQEVVVKPFEGIMSGIPGISGATVRGRGEVVNILDVTTL
ncbi:chemotaxis protein CheA [Natrinema ejinorense]|uniref:Chemotaxis protein CheA n=1 Tax=Natrinema ejinorense TaxID=373386 RepID=A0A2A5QVK9_9EURY|nr:chemotaxis protein CheA [Natrinema ejinorense]PCR90881.1 chemotaxis protein CheA [Natrinema ejinorense]